MPGRKFVVADIRGEIDLLQALMEKIVPVPEDYFLFTGSYLGPGKDSKAVLDYVIDFQKKFMCNFLLGCYEVLFQNVIAESEKGSHGLTHLHHLWKSMGGAKVLESYAKKTEMTIALEHGQLQRISLPFAIPETHISFMQKNLHLWYMDHDFQVVVFHAGPDPQSFQNPRQEPVVMGVNGWWDSDWNLPGTKVVFSHIPFDKPFRKQDKIGIDLGAGMGGSLCAYEMQSDDFVIVKAA